MIVLGTEDLVDDIAIVRQKDQAFGVLVQTPDRENAFSVPDEIDDVVLDVGLGGAGHTDRLVEGNVNLLFLGAHGRAVDAYLIAINDSRTQCGDLAVAGNAAGLDPLVRLAPRTGAGLADVLVEPQRGAGASCPRTR